MKESMSQRFPSYLLPSAFFFNTLSHYSFSHQRVCDIVTTFCPRLSVVGITKVQKNTAPP